MLAAGNSSAEAPKRARMGSKERSEAHERLSIVALLSLPRYSRLFPVLSSLQAELICVTPARYTRRLKGCGKPKDALRCRRSTQPSRRTS
jgi:hypothetical protein